MIKCLFLKNNLIGSRLIAWGTRRPGQKLDSIPSHCAFLFIVNGEERIIDSTLMSGVRETTLEEIIGHYELIETIDLGFSEQESYKYLEKARAKLVGRMYDVTAVIYFSVRVLLFKFFGIPIPTKSFIQFKFMWFCSEVYGFFSKKKENLTSPNDLLLLLRNKSYNIIQKE